MDELVVFFDNESPLSQCFPGVAIFACYNELLWCLCLPHLIEKPPIFSMTVRLPHLGASLTSLLEMHNFLPWLWASLTYAAIQTNREDAWSNIGKQRVTGSNASTLFALHVIDISFTLLFIPQQFFLPQYFLALLGNTLLMFYWYNTIKLNSVNNLALLLIEVYQKIDRTLKKMA